MRLPTSFFATYAACVDALVAQAARTQSALTRARRGNTIDINGALRGCGGNIANATRGHNEEVSCAVTGADES